MYINKPLLYITILLKTYENQAGVKYSLVVESHHNWLAIDKCGTMWLYQNKPKLSEASEGFIADSGDYDEIGKLEVELSDDYKTMCYELVHNNDVISGNFIEIDLIKYDPYLSSLKEDNYDVPERIVCAANKYGDYVIAGVRHGCDVMCDNLDTARTYKLIKAQVDHWDKEASTPKYREGHSCSYAVGELQEIMTNEGQDIPDFMRIEEVQGFLTNKYRFVDRQEAWKIAYEQKQLVRLVGGNMANGGTLYTENLY